MTVASKHFKNVLHHKLLSKLSFTLYHKTNSSQKKRRFFKNGNIFVLNYVLGFDFFLYKLSKNKL